MSEVKRYDLVCSEHFGAGVGKKDSGKYCLYSDYDELKAQRDALAAENEALKSAISYVCDTDNLPEYQYDGMGCGIEDRGITDRYEAARYGWDEAMERIYSEVMPCAADIETPATDAYLNSVRAEAVQALWDDSLNDVGQVLAEIRAYDDASEAAGIVHSEIQERVEDFAAQLRAGKDGE